ncbi:MAG: class I SAM-dependent methyltransferase [Promethearchaeota archaeon]
MKQNIIKTISFKLMAVLLKKMKKPENVRMLLENSGIKLNMKVLDYACGPGIFSIPAAELVGSEGIIYCADINQQAEKYIQKGIQKNQLSNVKMQIVDEENCKLDISDGEIDVVLLFDAIHLFNNHDNIFTEIHRVLKPNGILAVEIHHISIKKGIDLVKNVKDVTRKEELFRIYKKFLSDDPILSRLVLFEKKK